MHPAHVKTSRKIQIVRSDITTGRRLEERAALAAYLQTARPKVYARLVAVPSQPVVLDSITAVKVDVETAYLAGRSCDFTDHLCPA